MSLFSASSYIYLTKYINRFGQKKQLAIILEILGKFRSFLLKKRVFSRIMGAVMRVFEETEQKIGAKVEGKDFFNS